MNIAERRGSARHAGGQKFESLQPHRCLYGKADPSHEYTIREWVPDHEDDFERAVEIVRSLGEPAQFWSNTYTYLHLDGMKYWTMGSGVSQTTVLNRAESIEV